MKLRILLSGLALMAATTLVSAQTNNNTNVPKDTPVKGQAFVDNNNDGVCDNYQAGKAGQGICNGKRQGACKGQAACKGQGQGLAQGNGQGKGVCTGQGKPQGKGRNFADADKDGVCDNFKEPVKK